MHLPCLRRWMKRRRTGAELYSHYIRKLQLKHTKRIQKKYNSWYSAISFGLLDNVTRSFAHLHALNCVCRQGALNFTCRKWHSNCNNWAKENCEDVAMAWKPGVSWDDWDTLWEGVPILKGWSLQCNGKSFLLWSELSTDGTKWGWMARKVNAVHHIDLSSHRVSWFFLHMASWIKMSGNFYVSVASLVAFITLFCSISQRYM